MTSPMTSRMGSRMTLRVGRVGPDGTARFGPERVIRVSSSAPRPLDDNACRYPPCRCPEHRPEPREGEGGKRTGIPPGGFLVGRWTTWCEPYR